MISFDWAMKRLLRQKANFEVLEGFLSELLRRKIIIKNIGESEGNKTDEHDKWNKVDILVEADGKELVIIELQYDSENDYFQRMLYGVSKAVTEHIHEGDPYSAVRKVYSINIVYFDLGKGDDYIYYGVTNFKGLHTHNELLLTAKQQQLYGQTYPGDLYPEYYIIKVRGFNDVAKNTLDEWIYYLKNNRILDEFTAQGIDKARKVLAYDNLSDEEKIEYKHTMKYRSIRDAEMVTAFSDGEFKGRAEGHAEGRVEGHAEGRAEGRAEGHAEGRAEGLAEGEETANKKLIINSYRANFSIENISLITGLPKEDILAIIENNYGK